MLRASMLRGIGKEGWLGQRGLAGKKGKGFTQIGADQGADSRRFLIGREFGRVMLGGVAGFDPADFYAWRFYSNDF
jgi:hypothetical protein